MSFLYRDILCPVVHSGCSLCHWCSNNDKQQGKATTSRYRMEISGSKSKTVNITKALQGRSNIEWAHERKEQVEEIEYLGTTISANGKFDTEINNRVQKENQVYCCLNQTIVGKKETHNNTKMRIYQMVYLPTLTLWLKKLYDVNKT